MADNQHRQSRRDFLRRATLAGTALPFAGVTPLFAGPAKTKSPNERLNVGVVGVAARGSANLQGMSGENIAALCDIDKHRLGAAGEKHPHAAKYTDFRKLLEHPGLDCVVVSTPDHTHAHPVVGALEAGLDVYCEKPLAHSVWEVRKIRELTEKHDAVTQMGNQIHSGDNFRRVVEIVQSGLLGDVKRAHVIFEARQHLSFPSIKETAPPAHVDYDLWLGPAEHVPYSESRFHFNWRYWWNFGNGSLGDFGCHYMDLPHWALKLRAPKTIKATGEKGHDGVNECPLHMRVDYVYPATDDRPEVHFTWHQGKYMPEGFEEYAGGRRSGVLFEGTKGRLIADYRTHKVYMETEEEFTPPPQTIPSSIGHHAEFIHAVKTRGETACNFDYAGALSEAVLLGNVSYRSGQKELVWNAEKLQVENHPEAAPFIRREYRKGWELA